MYGSSEEKSFYMTDQQKIFFKNELKQLCVSIIQQRIDAAKQAIDNAQQAANNEEKSSAGDKYETSRAMNHLEKDMHSRQLSENRKELANLFYVNVNAIFNVAVPGSFLQCEGVAFFIAAGIGKQSFAGQDIFFLSPSAPLAKSLQKKRHGDTFLFNKNQTCIIDIY